MRTRQVETKEPRSARGRREARRKGEVEESRIKELEGKTAPSPLPAKFRSSILRSCVCSCIFPPPVSKIQRTEGASIESWSIQSSCPRPPPPQPSQLLIPSLSSSSFVSSPQLLNHAEHEREAVQTHMIASIAHCLNPGFFLATGTSSTTIG